MNEPTEVELVEIAFAFFSLVAPLTGAIGGGLQMVVSEAMLKMTVGDTPVEVEAALLKILGFASTAMGPDKWKALLDSGAIQTANTIADVAEDKKFGPAT